MSTPPRSPLQVQRVHSLSDDVSALASRLGIFRHNAVAAAALTRGQVELEMDSLGVLLQQVVQSALLSFDAPSCCSPSRSAVSSLICCCSPSTSVSFSQVHYPSMHLPAAVHRALQPAPCSAALCRSTPLSTVLPPVCPSSCLPLAQRPAVGNHECGRTPSESNETQSRHHHQSLLRLPPPALAPPPLLFPQLCS